jgi:hypothetical protein
MAMTPAALPSIATKIAVAPSRRSSSACRSSAAVAMFSSPRKRVAQHDAAALHHADRALAGRRVEAHHLRERDAALVRGGDDRGGERMLARLLDAGRERSTSPRRSPRVTIATTFGLPSVSVPVLSTTSVSTFSMRSSASAFLISTPSCAPRPTPTMIDIGVARPSAQGQAMISTVTAATMP